jgi:general secretion pathway protein D
LLKLQLYTEVSSIDPNSTNTVATGGYTLNKRSVQSTVLADNGEIIVLGGLISDNYQAGNQKVPLLGDITWLGQLFRSENKTRTKDNLMIFLRPIIVRDQEDSTAISMNRYDMIRAQQEGYETDNRLVKDRNVPQLPPVPPGPSQGAAPAENLFDLTRMSRQPQVPPSSAPAAPPTPAAPAPAAPPASPPGPGANAVSAPPVSSGAPPGEHP